MTRGKALTWLGLPAVSVLAGILVLEAALRLLGVDSRLPPGTAYLNFGPSLMVARHPLYPQAAGTEIAELFYRYKPRTQWATRYPDNPRGTFRSDNTVVYTLNNAGFRDADFERGKPPGAYRIALVGDSITLGEGVGDDDVFASLMERRLKSACARCEVLNFGVNGYGAHDELALLKLEVLGFEPDVVVWVWYPNDIDHIGMDRLGAGLAAERERRARFLDSPSYVVNFVSRRLWDAHVARVTLAFYRETYGAPAKFEEFKGLLRNAAASAAAAGARFIVALDPDLSAAGEKGYALAWVHAQVVSFLAAEGIAHVDLSAALLAGEPARLKVHPVDAHPNEEGHQIIARELLAALVRAGAVPVGE